MDDDFPDVVLAGSAHLGRKISERRSAAHDAQGGLVQRGHIGRLLNPGAAFLVIDGAVLVEGKGLFLTDRR